MSDDLHNIDDIFRDGLGEHREEPPAHIWSMLDEDLRPGNGISYRIRYRRLKWAAGFLLVFSVAAASYIGTSLLHKPGTRDQATVEKLKGLPNVADSSVQTNQISQGLPKQAAVSGIEIDGQQAGSDYPSNPRKENSRELVVAGSVPSVTDIIRTDQQHRIGFKENVTVDLGLNNTEEIKVPASHSTLSTAPEEIRNAKTRILPADLLAVALFNQQLILQKRKGEISFGAGKASGLDIPEGFSVTGFASPNFSFNRVKEIDQQQGQPVPHHEPDGDEAYPVSFSAGLAMQYPLSARLYLRSGVSYTSARTEMAPHKLYAKDDRQGRVHYELQSSVGSSSLYTKAGSTMSGDSAFAFQSKMQFHYLTVPFGVSYRIPAGRFSLWPSAAAGINILLGAKTHANLLNSQNLEQQLSGSVKGVRTTYFDAQLGLGIDYRLGRRIAVEFRPNARLAINSVNRESGIQAFRNFFSLESGLKYEF